ADVRFDVQRTVDSIKLAEFKLPDAGASPGCLDIEVGGMAMSTIKRALAIGALLLLQSAFVVRLEAQTNAPAGMTQQQFDTLVEAISNSVTEKLKAEGAQAAPVAAAPASPAAKPAASDSKGGKASKPPPGPKIVKMPPKEGPDSFTVFFER